MIRLFSLELPKFSKIVMCESVIENIIDFAKSNYPKEFVALLRGEVKDGKLIVDGLIYQPFVSSKRASSIKLDVPTLSKVVGSVHSHPSSYTEPSNADLQFFNKTGMVHLIIGFPYRDKDIACYDFKGNMQNFGITKDRRE